MDVSDHGNTAKHWSPGQALTVGVSLLKAKKRIAFDSGSPAVAMIRARLNGSGDPLGEWLDSDLTWKTGDDVYFWACTASPADSKLAAKTFAAADTASWTHAELLAFGYAEVAGVPEMGVGFIEAVGAAFPHSLGVSGLHYLFKRLSDGRRVAKV